MPDRIPEIVERITALLDETTLLRIATEAVVPSVERETKRGKYTRIAVGLLGLIVAVQTVFGILLFQALSTQDATNQRVLCPVFSLLVGGYNPDSRQPGPDRDAYNAQFSIMRSSYLELNCRGGFVPAPIRE
jgi:hypothetical protein